MAFHWNSDPAANAAGKYSTEYVQLPMEIEDRYRECLNQASLTQDQIKKMEYINYLWMSEMVDQEKGGQRTACSIIAVEAERHGDFTLAEFARRGEARFYRVVAIPFHEKSARESVRLAAAKALAGMCWAEGWAACYGHSDAEIRAVIAPLLEPAVETVVTRTSVLTELIKGLGSSSAETCSFCQTALESISGRKMHTGEWSIWWKKLGDPQPGLIRTGPGVPPEVDRSVDFGSWWQSAYYHKPNPLLKYEPPATIRWDGYIIVTQPGEYRFYARNCGEGKDSRNSVRTPGRTGFPGLYLPELSVRLTIGNKMVLPNPPDAVQDPPGIRLDFSEPINLGVGLHRIHLEFEYRSKRTGFWVSEPCLRLYWSSKHFPQEVVPSRNLVTLKANTP